MKFTNALTYRVMDESVLADAAAIEAGMAPFQFVPCSPSQESSSGWVPPRAEEGALLEPVAGHLFARYQIETRSVPTSALKKRVQEMCDEIEKQTGRTPGRREKKELKEDALQQLLPQAFPRQLAINVWLDPKAGLIVLDTANHSRADAVASALVKAITGLALGFLTTAKEPSFAMGTWLLDFDSIPEGFSIDRACELKALDGSRAAVRYVNHPLDTQEVQDHIRAGMRPAHVAMTWDDRVSFTLTDGGHLRSLRFLEGTMDNPGDSSAEAKADAFDADAAITAGELGALYAALVDALGGEQQKTIAEAA